MASDVDICNQALAHLGAEQLIASINPPDGSAEAGYAKTFYPIARRELIDLGAFAFTFKRTSLALLQTNPSSAWAYAYALPSDCISALRVLRGDYLAASGLALQIAPGCSLPAAVDQVFTERGSALFEIEGDTLLTNEPEAILKYKADVLNTGKFTPLFISAFGMLLASYLAGPIIKGREGMETGKGWRGAALSMLAAAATSDANAEAGTAYHIPTSIRARA